MADRNWITEEEFEIAARFLQVVALMKYRGDDNYSEYFHRRSFGYSSNTSNERKQLREWLESQVPKCTGWTSNPSRGTTVQWDGTVLSLRNRERVLAKFNLPMLLTEVGRPDSHALIHGADVTDNKTFEGRADLRELTCVGTLGRVLSLLDKNPYYRDITATRKAVSRTLQDAGIHVVFSELDDTFDDSLIVWGDYRAPIDAVERQEALENRRVTALSVPIVRSWFRKPKPEPKPEPGAEAEPEPAHKRPLPPELRAKLYTWVAVGIVASILLTAGVVSWNESNPGIFIEVSCLAASVGVSILAILDT